MVSACLTSRFHSAEADMSWGRLNTEARKLETGFEFVDSFDASDDAVVSECSVMCWLMSLNVAWWWCCHATPGIKRGGSWKLIEWAFPWLLLLVLPSMWSLLSSKMGFDTDSNENRDLGFVAGDTVSQSWSNGRTNSWLLTRQCELSAHADLFRDDDKLFTGKEGERRMNVKAVVRKAKVFMVDFAWK